MNRLERRLGVRRKVDPPGFYSYFAPDNTLVVVPLREVPPPVVLPELFNRIRHFGDTKPRKNDLVTDTARAWPHGFIARLIWRDNPQILVRFTNGDMVRYDREEFFNYSSKGGRTTWNI